MLNVVTLNSKLIALEMQFKVLQAELSRFLTPQTLQLVPSFAALEGIWGGQGNFSLAEIQEAELQVPADL